MKLRLVFKVITSWFTFKDEKKKDTSCSGCQFEKSGKCLCPFKVMGKCSNNYCLDSN